MKPYFHEYRSNREVATLITNHKMRSWYLSNPEPSGRETEEHDWMLWAARLELEWDALFDSTIEGLLARVHHGRT